MRAADKPGYYKSRWAPSRSLSPPTNSRNSTRRVSPVIRITEDSPLAAGIMVSAAIWRMSPKPRAGNVDARGNGQGSTPRSICVVGPCAVSAAAHASDGRRGRRSGLAASCAPSIVGIESSLYPLSTAMRTVFPVSWWTDSDRGSASKPSPKRRAFPSGHHQGAPRASGLRGDRPARTRSRAFEGLESVKKLVLGDHSQVSVDVDELRWVYDLMEGQKTGGYHDQLENQRAALEWREGGLDCCSYEDSRFASLGPVARSPPWR